MRKSRNSVSLATVGLTFAVVLSPALMQTETTCSPGNAQLSMLEFEVAGENLIIFDSLELVYDVLVPEGIDIATVRAESVDPTALVGFVPEFGDQTPAEALTEEKVGNVGTGGGEVIWEPIPPGESTMSVMVQAPQGEEAVYMIHVIRSNTCP